MADNYDMMLFFFTVCVYVVSIQRQLDVVEELLVCPRRSKQSCSNVTYLHKIKKERKKFTLFLLLFM